jgi:hypothetical protein
MTTSKTAKPNVRDNFEDVLLYTSGYLKVRDQVDEAWLRDPQFCKVVQYMAKTFFQKNSGLLTMLGYEMADVHTVVCMYALRFMAMNYKAETDRSRYMFLMRHLSQRFGRFRDILERKYSTKNVMHVPMPGTLDRFAAEPPDETATLDEQVEILEEERDTLRAEAAGLASGSLDRLAVDADITATAEELNAALARRKARVKRSAEVTKELRGRLASLPRDQVISKMAYYATLRSVATEVRDSARQYCRAHDIDYVGWAKRYIRQHNFDESEFVF